MSSEVQIYNENTVGRKVRFKRQGSFKYVTRMSRSMSGFAIATSTLSLIILNDITLLAMALGVSIFVSGLNSYFFKNKSFRYKYDLSDIEKIFEENNFDTSSKYMEDTLDLVKDNYVTMFDTRENHTFVSFLIPKDLDNSFTGSLFYDVTCRIDHNEIAESVATALTIEPYDIADLDDHNNIKVREALQEYDNVLTKCVIVCHKDDYMMTLIDDSTINLFTNIDLYNDLSTPNLEEIETIVNYVKSETASLIALIKKYKTSKGRENTDNRLSNGPLGQFVPELSNSNGNPNLSLL